MIDWIKTIIQNIGYTGIALLMVLENICPPIPSEIIMPFAGFISSQGGLSFFGIIIAGTLGSVAGTLPFYFLGRRIGEAQLMKWTKKYGYWLLLYPRDIERSQKWFDKYDTAAVLICRLVPGLRTLISLPAGFSRMNFGTFFSLSLIGTSIWTGILTYFGKILGQNYDKVEHYIDPFSYVIIAGIVMGYIVLFIRRTGGNK